MQILGTWITRSIIRNNPPQKKRDAHAEVAVSIQNDLHWGQEQFLWCLYCYLDLYIDDIIPIICRWRYHERRSSSLSSQIVLRTETKVNSRTHARTGNPISMRDIGQQLSSRSCSLKQLRRRTLYTTNSAFAKSQHPKDERTGSKMVIRRS